MSGLVASSSCTACQEGTTWSWEGSPQQPPSPRDPPTPSAVGSEEHPRVVGALPPQEPGPPQPHLLPLQRSAACSTSAECHSLRKTDGQASSAGRAPSKSRPPQIRGEVVWVLA